MTGEQIDPERNVEKGKEKMKERGGRQVVSGTIQLPSELYWISPPFKMKRQISLSSPFGSHRKNHIIFLDSPGARSLYLPSFSNTPPHYNSEHCGILALKLCIFKYQADLRKGVLFFFLLHFFYLWKKKSKRKKEDMCLCVRVHVI